jgi:hypothetical protein
MIRPDPARRKSMLATPVRWLFRAASALALVATGGLAGCDEDHAPAPQAQSAPSPPPPPVDQAPASGPTAGGAGQPGSALGGAKRAGQNTADKIGERQQELEDALDEN